MAGKKCYDLHIIGVVVPRRCKLKTLIKVLLNSLPAEIKNILRRRAEEISSKGDVLQIWDEAEDTRELINQVIIK